MSLWTPGGEHEVPRSPAPEPPRSQPAGPSPTTDGAHPDDLSLEDALEQLSPEERAKAEQMLAEMAEAQDRIASVPAADMIVNHLGGIYELAAIHLNQEPPRFADAALAIEALGAVVERLEGRLGAAEPSLRDALRNIQLAFVQLKQRGDAPPPGDDASADGGGAEF